MSPSDDHNRSQPDRWGLIEPSARASPCADHQVASDVEGSILIVGVTIPPQTIGDVIA
jgi:hypothetical protein